VATEGQPAESGTPAEAAQDVEHGAGHGAEAHSPLEQFDIEPILPITVGNLDLSFTNSSLWMAISVLLAYGLVMLATRNSAEVPGRLQSLVELSYDFVAGMVRENAGHEGRQYFPFFFTLFMFILFGNTLGMLPGSFTFTSHIIVTFSMAIFVLTAVTVLGVIKHGAHFVRFFAPGGVPGFVLPLLVPIEILSYLMRPVSLSLRLAINMTAGHIMLVTFAGFIVALGIFGVAPFALTVALVGLELAIAFLQAYVFTVLSCIYLHDCLHMH
jgi:F-type H+-transporting ATPase subunit a